MSGVEICLRVSTNKKRPLLFVCAQQTGHYGHADFPTGTRGSTPEGEALHGGWGWWGVNGERTVLSGQHRPFLTGFGGFHPTELGLHLRAPPELRSDPAGKVS